MTAHVTAVTSRKRNDSSVTRRETGSRNATEEIRRIARRLHDLEKEAAVLGSEVLGLEAVVREAKSEPKVPALAYRVEQVAEALNVGTSLVYSMLGTGELPSLKREGVRWVLVRDLEAYLETLRESPDSEV